VVDASVIAFVVNRTEHFIMEITKTTYAAECSRLEDRVGSGVTGYRDSKIKPDQPSLLQLPGARTQLPGVYAWERLIVLYVKWGFD